MLANHPKTTPIELVKVQYGPTNIPVPEAIVEVIFSRLIQI